MVKRVFQSVLHLSFYRGYQTSGCGDRLDAKVMQWSFTLWDNHDVTSDAIKREGYSKPKRQSNKIADTQQNTCFEEAHEFSRSDVGMEMLSSFLQEAKIPTRQMQHCSSMVPCPAAGSAP